MATDYFTIERSEAAERLGVSTRTLDRWLKSGKLKSKSVGRSILIDIRSLEKAEKAQSKKKPRVKKVEGEKVEKETAEQVFEEKTTPKKESRGEEKVFQKLYEEAASELKAKQEKLEAASFRVGQLETQVQNSVPLLEYKAKEDDFQAVKNELANQILHEKRKSVLLLAGMIGAGVIATCLGILLAFF